MNKFEDLLYESTSGKFLAPAVNSEIFMPKDRHSCVDSESKVYENFISFS